MVGFLEGQDPVCAEVLEQVLSIVWGNLVMFGDSLSAPHVAAFLSPLCEDLHDLLEGQETSGGLSDDVQVIVADGSVLREVLSSLSLLRPLRCIRVVTLEEGGEGRGERGGERGRGRGERGRGRVAKEREMN